jgi:hypothetical protein
LLCPNSTTKYIRCPTLSHGIDILKETQFPEAKTFIVHCGTNDIEELNASETLQKLKTLESQLHKKHPQARVILSLLLPRADTLNKTVISLNEEIKKEFEDTPHTVTVNHPNITQEDLKDRKHLTPKGVKCLAKNLKASFFGTTPKPAGKPQMKRPPSLHRPTSETTPTHDHTNTSITNTHITPKTNYHHLPPVVTPSLQ